MSQIDEDAILKSARFLYKSGYTDEAKAILQKLNTPQSKSLLGKMGGSGKVKESSQLSPRLIGLVIAGCFVLSILGFGLGWSLAPKTQETMLLESINEELQVDDSVAATQTQEQANFFATSTVISDSNRIVFTQISASATAAVLAATTTAEANGQ